jgi:hypothetical protein
VVLLDSSIFGSFISHSIIATHPPLLLLCFRIDIELALTHFFFFARNFFPFSPLKCDAKVFVSKYVEEKRVLKERWQM